ncbi:hypothetical protein [Alkaliphilus peptidifermentans]|uniref:Uncharacterized protein n=1 Tax=Alkaliphilus peptidifermentans DSM 18978 TaxID=1120976 RepID=A0A1G5GH94_9FIRM|nr:hypothetical protein [Alkaliphilus peptidifermentans]SCY50731.1 hypothetical protein SAMN03080606_01686 [Alkaliphilus peptidifermentans DSM 18978]
MRFEALLRIGGMVLIVIAVGMLTGAANSFIEPVTVNYALEIIKGFILLLLGILLAFDVQKLILKRR